MRLPSFTTTWMPRTKYSTHRININHIIGPQFTGNCIRLLFTKIKIAMYQHGVIVK